MREEGLGFLEAVSGFGATDLGSRESEGNSDEGAFLFVDIMLKL